MKKIILLLALFNFHNLSAQVNLTDGLVALYLFSSNTDDYSGNDNHSLLIGDATTSDQVLSCGGNNLDGLSLPYTLLDGVIDFSIGFDIKFDNFHGDINTSGKTNIIVSGWRESGVGPIDNELNIEYLKHGISDNQSIENSIRIFINNQRFTFSNVDLSEGIWYNLILTRQSNILELYVNGFRVGNGITATDSPLSIMENGLIVGQEQDELGGGFVADQSMEGQMDNLCVFQRAINQDEVNEIYLNSHSTTVSNNNIKNSALGKMIQIFPNPINTKAGVLNIKNESPLMIESILIYDFIGNLIEIHEIESRESKIQIYPLRDLNNAIPQLLIIDVVLENGNKLSYKILQENL